MTTLVVAGAESTESGGGGGRYDEERHVRTWSFVPHPESVVDPLVEEASWLAWELDATDPGALGEATLSTSTGAFDLLVETAWRPGRSAVMTEVAYEPGDEGGRLIARLALCALGPEGTTAAELVGLVPGAQRAMAAGGARLFRPIDPGLIVGGSAHGQPASPEPTCAHLLQGHWSTGDDEDVISVVSRFRPTLEPWTSVAAHLVGWGQAIRVRASVLATEFFPADRQELRRTLARIRALRARNEDAPDVVFDAERAEATVLHLWAGLGSPLFVAELAVRSDDPVADSVLRAIGATFTSSGGVVRHDGQVSVAPGVVLGGMVIERDTPRWREAQRLGLPLSGGIRRRTLRDLVTLHESPIGWPLPFRDVLASLPVRTGRGRPVPPLLRPSPGRQETTIGTSPEGTVVALPVELRTRHTVVTGAWGAGKSTFLLTQALDDLAKGRRMVFLDPHGTAAPHLLASARALGREPVVIDAFDGRTERLAFLPALRSGPRSREAVETAARRTTEAVVSWLPTPEWAGPVFFSVFEALLEVVAAHRAELADGARWLLDPDELSRRVLHPLVSPLAHSTLAHVTRSGDHAGDLRGWVASKLHPLVHGAVRRVLAPAGEGLDVASAVRSGRPVIASLAGLSESEVALVGHLVVASILDDAFSRPVDEKTELLGVYVDEAHRFPPRGLSRVVAEGRKFGVALSLSTQALSQLEGEIADLAQGAGTLACFRATPDTADRLGVVLGVEPRELVGLPDLSCVLGVKGHPPTLVELAPIAAASAPYVRAPAAPGRSRRARQGRDDAAGAGRAVAGQKIPGSLDAGRPRKTGSRPA